MQIQVVSSVVIMQNQSVYSIVKQCPGSSGQLVEFLWSNGVHQLTQNFIELHSTSNAFGMVVTLLGSE